MNSSESFSLASDFDRSVKSIDDFGKTKYKLVFYYAAKNLDNVDMLSSEDEVD